MPNLLSGDRRSVAAALALAGAMLAASVLSPSPVLAAGGGACATSAGGQDVTTWVAAVTPPGYYVTAQQWYQPRGYWTTVTPPGRDITVQQWYQPPGYDRWVQPSGYYRTVQQWYQPPGYDRWVRVWYQPPGYETYRWAKGWHLVYPDGFWWKNPVEQAYWYRQWYWYQPPGYLRTVQQWYQPPGYLRNVQEWYQPPGYYSWYQPSGYWRNVQEWYQPPSQREWVQPAGYLRSVQQWYQPPTVPGHNVTRWVASPPQSICMSVGLGLPPPYAPVAITGMPEHFWLTGDTSSVADVTWTFGHSTYPLQGTDVYNAFQTTSMFSYPQTGKTPYSAQITWADGATATVTGSIKVIQVQSAYTG